MGRMHAAGLSALLSGLLAANLAACAADDPRDVGATTEWIVDGVLDSTPQVVFIYNSRRGGMCSGSLIANRVVLTAKHCVQEDGEAGPDAPRFFTIGVGDQVNRPVDTYGALEITTTPGSYDERLRGLVGQDIALITLRNGISLEPMVVHRGDGAALVGQTVTAIGFGQTPSGRSGTKYRASAQVRFTDGNVLYTGPLTCQGDSGGPILNEDGEIVAVTSFGDRQACGAGGYAGSNRVDVFLDMIDQVVGDSGACLNDGAERCDGFDNDCNEQIDETCQPLGATCSTDDECVGGEGCMDTPAGRICTVECDPQRPEISCPSGLYCASMSGCDGVCLPLPAERPAALGDGAPCTSDLECMSLFCTDPGDGNQRCLTPCRGGDGICLSGDVCAAGVGSCGGCVPAEIVNGLRGLGEPCAADDECVTGRCLDEAGVAYCTRDCTEDSECSTSGRFHCRVEDGAGSCIRGPVGGFGDACVRNGDCIEGTFCATRAGVSWCSAFCSEETPCQEGFSCVEAGGATICAPDRGVTGDVCAMDDECISGLCGDEGACTRECSPDSPCPGAFECVRGADGATAQCVAPSVAPVDSGCSTVGAGVGQEGDSSSTAAWLALLGFFALIRRRRQ